MTIKNEEIPVGDEGLVINKYQGYIRQGNIITYIKSKSTYSVGINGVRRRISRKAHES